MLRRFGAGAVEPYRTSDPVAFFRSLIYCTDRYQFEELAVELPRQRRALVARARQSDISGTLANLTAEVPTSGLLNHALNARHRELVLEALKAAGAVVVLKPDPVVRRSHLNGQANGQPGGSDHIAPVTARPNLGARLHHRNGKARP
jgi:hypothetical protein